MKQEVSAMPFFNGKVRTRCVERKENLKIDSSMIGMESARRYQSSSTRASRFSVMDYAQAKAQMEAHAQTEGGVAGEGTGQEPEESQMISRDGNAVYAWTDLEALQQKLGRVSANKVSLREQGSTVESFRQLSLKFIFNLMFGSERTRSIFGDDSGVISDGGLSQGENTSLSEGGLMSSKVLVYSRQISFYEKEETSFSATGCVKTADGREISFNVDVAMSREFQMQYEEEFGFASIQTCDPLVLNFDGDVADITDQSFYFDLDQDGEKDLINKLGSGSGYLALDLDGNGTIDDGSELFGTKSGDGFRDLSAYDEDGNGWIDENDSIWSKLQIWCKTPTEDKLYTLAEKGVGAICLSNASTEFSVQKEGQTGGIIRKTGVFLYESGVAGTVQHVDMVKQYLA